MALKKSLRTDMASLAETLQSLGRGKDTVLAHITPKEAALLKARGGRGSRNPQTGLLEFDETVYDTGTFTPPPVSTPTFQVPSQSKQTQQAQTPPPVTSNNAPETVTVTGQSPAAASPSFTPTITPLQAPQMAAPVAAAPVAAAPETVTVMGQNQQPQQAPPIITPATAGGGGGAAPAAQPGAPTSNNTTKSWLSNNATLLSLLGLGGLGVFGGINNAKAGQQAGALQDNIAALGQPLQTQANQQLATTLNGGLTPQNMQVLQAAQAQLKQGETSGAVSSQQAAETVATTFANLLNTQMNQAISLLNTADAYLQNAYLQGYQANVTNQTNTTNFYTNLANLATKVLG